MAQLNIFNGGLSTRLAPHLININEALVLNNVDVSLGSLASLKTDKDENETVGKSMVYFKNKWVYSANNLDYVIFQDILYYSGLGIPQKSTDGTTWYNLGIVGSSVLPTIILDVTTGYLNGDYQYCYTYYNSTDGTESQPSPYSVVLTATNQSIKVSFTASSDPQVDKIRIYRLGGHLTTMSLVAVVNNATSFHIDTLADDNVLSDVLKSQLYGQALSGLKYLTSANAMFFGALDDKLYYSEVAYVNAWSPYNFIDFDEPITGLGACSNGLLVFTEYSTYIVTGTNPTTLSKYLVSNNQGCLLHKSIKYVANNLVWLSHDGLCTSNGSDIQVVTRGKLGKLSFLYPVGAVVYDDVYYLAYQDGLFVADFRFGTIFYTVSGSVDCLHVKNDILYYSYNNKLYSMFRGNQLRAFNYRSPNLADGSISNLKTYKVVYIYSTSDVIFDLYVEGKKAISKNLEAGLNEVKIPTAYTNAYYISFNVSGKGEVFEIEYKVEGRQNGR